MKRYGNSSGYGREDERPRRLQVQGGGSTSGNLGSRNPYGLQQQTQSLPARHGVRSGSRMNLAFKAIGGPKSACTVTSCRELRNAEALRWPAERRASSAIPWEP